MFGPTMFGHSADMFASFGTPEGQQSFLPPLEALRAILGAKDAASQGSEATRRLEACR